MGEIVNLRRARKDAKRREEAVRAAENRLAHGRSKAKRALFDIARELEHQPGTVVRVTKRGKSVMTLVSSELYEALVETLEILGDAAAMNRLRKALREIKARKAILWKSARKKLGL